MREWKKRQFQSAGGARMARGLWALVLALGGLAVMNAAQAAFVNISRVSVASDGSQGLNGVCTRVGVSDNGRWVVFDSTMDNLVPGDTNGQSDIFLHDRTTGATSRISVDVLGQEVIAFSAEPAISGDGNVIAWVSNGEFTPNAAGRSHVFVHDRTAQTVELVDRNTAGDQGIYDSNKPSLSYDGRYVAFISSSFNLVDGDTNDMTDVFVRDRQTQVTERVNLSTAGEQSNATGGGYPHGCGISRDGRYVGFTDYGSNLADTNDVNGWHDAFLHDRQLGTTEMISVTPGGLAANDGSDFVGVSDDGRYVTFFSIAGNVVAGDLNGVTDMFVRDRQTGTTQLVSVSSTGAQGFGFSFNFNYTGGISGDGRFVVFGSHSNNLVPGDTGQFDVFIRDRSANTTERLSRNNQGQQPNGHSSVYGPAISGDGTAVVFISTATNLVPNDTNDTDDVFAVTYAPGVANRAPDAAAGADQVLAIPHDGTPVTNTVQVNVNGNGSTDPDNDSLTYQWRDINGNVLGATPAIQATLGAGTHLLTLNVTDPGGLFDEDSVQITVQAEPNAAPVPNAGPDQTITTDETAAKVVLDGSGSSDPDGDLIAWRWKSDAGQIGLGRKPTVSLNQGQHNIRLFVTDTYGVERTDEVSITVNSGLAGGNFPL